MRIKLGAPGWDLLVTHSKHSVGLDGQLLQTHTHAHTNTQTYTYTHTHTGAHTHTHTCTHMCTHTYTRTRAHARMPTEDKGLYCCCSDNSQIGKLSHTPGLISPCDRKHAGKMRERWFNLLMMAGSSLSFCRGQCKKL